MLKLNFFLLLFLLLFFGCATETPPSDDSVEDEVLETSLEQSIIRQCIERHGGSKYENSNISFDFRKRSYRSSIRDGSFIYERITKDETKGQIHDKLTNQGLRRTINGTPVALSPKDSAAYANSVNSVIYFALLPYFLLDEAVQTEYLDTVTVKQQPYHKIKVTFRQEGGGRDFQDEYIYWIHQEENTLDYLAYNYIVDGGGARFREAYNARFINGIRFADYINYKPSTETMKVETFDQLLENGELKELSKIETENISVETIN